MNSARVPALLSRYASTFVIISLTVEVTFFLELSVMLNSRWFREAVVSSHKYIMITRKIQTSGSDNIFLARRLQKRKGIDELSLVK
jgi:hypothetical protein